jgi:hypothetical protein
LSFIRSTVDQRSPREKGASFWSRL